MLEINNINSWWDILQKLILMFDSGTMGLEVPPQVATTVFATIAMRLVMIKYLL